MTPKVCSLIAAGLLAMAPWPAYSQSRSANLAGSSDPRGPAELVVCSQNLENFGRYSDVKLKKAAFTLEDYGRKKKALFRRFTAVDCDVIAFQEFLGKDERTAGQFLNEFALEFRKASNRFYSGIVGGGSEQGMFNGFLVAQDRAAIVNSLSYEKVELPKLIAQEKPRFFLRGPLEVQLEVKPRGESFAKTVSLVTYHFKSRAGAQADPTGLEWETYRMQMAEALRRVVEERHAQSFASGETLLLVLGDRNSHFDTATAKILEGVLTLQDFQNGSCRLSKRGVPLCQTGAASPARLFSVLTGDPLTRSLQGTFKRGKTFSWLDEISVPAETLRAALRDPAVEGQYDSGVINSPPDASDHAMIYVRLNW